MKSKKWAWLALSIIPMVAVPLSIASCAKKPTKKELKEQQEAQQARNYLLNGIKIMKEELIEQNQDIDNIYVPLIDKLEMTPECSDEYFGALGKKIIYFARLKQLNENCIKALDNPNITWDEIDKWTKKADAFAKEEYENGNNKISLKYLYDKKWIRIKPAFLNQKNEIENIINNSTYSVSSNLNIHL